METPPEGGAHFTENRNYRVDSISKPHASSSASGIYFEFLFRLAHSRRRVERTYWSGVSLYSFTTCSKEVTVGTTGPIGSGLPQFGLPRRFAISYLSFALLFKQLLHRSNAFLLLCRYRPATCVRSLPIVHSMRFKVQKQRCLRPLKPLSHHSPGLFARANSRRTTSYAIPLVIPPAGTVKVRVFSPACI